ncbi:HlyD family efflux transporter periplasmic adaptor subunit [Iningainema tapete]|uniref:HlyD family efflux transporter periplasmic adaptor subunit n=1 Tax=Iningainema tapete BLCC-T55 TaxID=2748662 RepID=A0A8J6XIW8_9CYAN|nr:HlyD family efflux transporter periplasmic adaptor subunit [Iningainema tapete]MBD2773637.1 HlyD family efflux transporter periplasmic adaptor subunit [Iningainema tapete BLCC-T55]
MPFVSRNSSARAQPSPDDEQNYKPNQTESTNLNPVDTEDTNDWFLGTEELLDALPRPWTRSILYVLIGFAMLVVPWAMLSKIDETGTARGRIEPLGATRKLDSPATGSVTAVKVKEGETVKTGQVLVELESDVLRTELQQAQAKLSGLQSQRQQLNLLKNQVELAIRVQNQQNQAQQSEKLAQIQQAQQNLDTLQTNYYLQKEEKLAQVNQKKLAIDSIKAAYELAQVRYRGAQEKVPRYKKAYQEGVLPQDRLMEIQQSVKENYQNLLQAKSEISRSQSSLKEEQSSYERTIRQANSDIQQAQLRLQEQQRSYKTLIHTGKLSVLKSQEQIKDLQSQITAIQSQIAQTGSMSTSLKLQMQQRVVRSPVDGVIFELPIKKPGQVVQPGQLIASIAPNGSPLVLKAQMPIQHSGFLKVGMPVKIKFDAYPFQDYGVISGNVNWISPDSKISTTTAGNLETFELDITLKQPYIKTENKQTPLTPGQTATADVIIRQRRVIDFLLDPFKKLHQ